MLKFGLVGKPNVGKSTLFSALTKNQVEIANYPFTTLKPNVGVTFLRIRCPHNELGKDCNPREGFCRDGIRHVPVEVVDVPGLIPGASQGKGMGNEFMDSIRDSQAICHILDGSGMTMPDGVPSEHQRDPIEDVSIIENEIITWFADRIFRDWDRFAKKADSTGERTDRSLGRKLASFGITEKDIATILSKEVFPAKLGLWTESDSRDFAEAVFRYIKPVFRIFNKADRMDKSAIQQIRSSLERAYFVSAEYELALAKAFESHLIDGTGENFTISDKATKQQTAVLERIREFLRSNDITRILDITGELVQKALGYVVVFPVVDETAWTDNNGNVLPDAFLMPSGSTALDLAYKIHTDIGEGFIRAVDCRTRRAIGKDHVLQNSDIIRIVAKTK